MSRVFFVARAFPPVLGGIENHNHQLAGWLADGAGAVCIVNPRGKKAIPAFFLATFARLLLRARPGDVLVLGDGVLAPLGWLLRWLRGMRVVIVVHGLDITYGNPVYQALWVGMFMPALDRIVAVSNATREEAVRKGLPADHVLVIPNAIEPGEYCYPLPGGAHERLPDGRDAAQKIVLVTVGRLVRRKGVAWFVGNVMPLLDGRFVYLVAGDGGEGEAIAALVREKGLQDRVFLLGRVDDARKKELLAQADYFIQPNIDVPGDVEGFGISVIEASACGVMVLASDIQGLKDSVLAGRTGDRLPCGDAEAWARYLQQHPAPRLAPADIARATIDEFSSSAVAARYLALVAGMKR